MSFVDSLKKGLFGSEDDYDDQYMDDGPQMVNNNNGVGMDEDALNKLYTLLDSDQPGHKENYEWASIGLKNVHDRLRYLYGSDYGITLYSTPGVGTVVKATIPADLQNLAQEEPLC